MNKARRNKLKDAISYMTIAKNIIKNVKTEEEFVYDNIPENLQYSNKASDMEDNIDVLDESIDIIDDLISSIDDI